MKKGSYIWDITVETKWNHQDESETFETTDYTVASASFENACKKVLSLHAKDRCFKSWMDTQEDGTKKTFSVERVEIIKVNRGNWIDG